MSEDRAKDAADLIAEGVRMLANSAAFSQSDKAFAQGEIQLAKGIRLMVEYLKSEGR